MDWFFISSPATCKAVKRPLSSSPVSCDMASKPLLLACCKNMVPKNWLMASTSFFMYLPHARGKADVERTLLHEGVAHYGLRKLAGHKHMDAFLDDIFNGCGEKVRDEILRMAAADKNYYLFVHLQKVV